MIAAAIRKYVIGLGPEELRGLLTSVRGELAVAQLRVLAEVVGEELEERARVPVEPVSMETASRDGAA